MGRMRFGTRIRRAARLRAVPESFQLARRLEMELQHSKGNLGSGLIYGHNVADLLVDFLL
jgi:hypothetical protein